MYCISLTGFHIEEEFEEKKTYKIELFFAHWVKRYTKAHQSYSMWSYINLQAYLFSDSHLPPTEYSEPHAA